MSERRTTAPRFLRYPRGRLLAVIDAPAAAEAAVRDLVATGIDPARVETWHGVEAAAVFDGTGIQHGLAARARRAVEFLLMDQAPDMAWYEAAVRGGRTVISLDRHTRPRSVER